jgi:hypothetical protein
MPAMGRVRWFGVLVLALAPTASGEEGWMFDPRFRAGRAGDLLAEGPPPLLRSQLDAFVDLLEASFDLAVPVTHEQRIRDAFERTYAQSSSLEREGFAGLVAPLPSLRGMLRRGDRAGAEEGLAAFRRALDLRLAAAPSREEHLLTAQVLQLRQRVAWPGDPPVPASAAVAWLELTGFLAAIARNEVIEPTIGQRAQLEADLAEPLHRAPEPMRRRLREGHRTWLRTKAAWDEAQVGKRLRLRWAAIAVVERLLPHGDQAVHLRDGDLEAYARAARAVATAERPFDAWINLAANPALVLEQLDAWLGPAPPGEDEPLLCR